MGLVQQFVPSSPINAFDEGIVGWLAWRDVAPVDPDLSGPAQDRRAGDPFRLADNSDPAGDDGIQILPNPYA